MSSILRDPSVARLTRRRKPLPVWFWLVACGLVVAATVASVSVATGWSVFHPLETPDERAIRMELEGRFRPVRIESADYQYTDDDNRRWYRIKYWRPAPLSSGWVSTTKRIAITPDGMVDKWSW